MISRKLLISGMSILILLALLCLLCYNYFFAPTRVALVGFPPYQVANFVLSLEDKRIEVDEIGSDEAQRLTGYDAILIFAPGFRPTEEQSIAFDRSADAGIPIYSTVSTSNTVQSRNLSEVQQARLDTYYKNAMRANFRNMLLYLREEFDRTKLSRIPADEPIELPLDVFYHTEEGRFYETADALKAHLREEGLYHEDAPNIALISGAGFPVEGNRAHIDSLINIFTRRGMNVYPFTAKDGRVRMLRELKPDAVIYLPMGRYAGDEGVKYFTESNTLCFAPLPIPKSREEWLDDPQGASGGYLTARVVLPEIDGALLPLVISTQQEAKDGIQVHYPDMERLNNFIDNAINYVSLRTKPNSEKRVGIYFFRGAGQNSLVATGLEVAQSMYNFLLRLKTEGYDVSGLPATFETFNRMLHRQGAVWGSYSKGAIDEFLQNGSPEWVTVSEYESWVGEEIGPEKYKEVVSTHGKAPGDYLAGTYRDEPALAIACMKFGNVVVLPQPRAGLDGDDFKMTHGTGAPPPHGYIVSYLWLRKKIGVDLLVHFGTHGSLEFTQGKQAALGHSDWADRLVGTTPHIYYYSISNVGEGIIAKRRLHATLVSYLTPPFMESRTREQYRDLLNALEEWRQSPDSHKGKASLAVKKMVVRLGIHRDLQMDGDTARPYSEEEMTYIENFIEEVANEKMTGRLYTLGVPYAPQDIASTVIAMTADPIAHQLAHLALLDGSIDRKAYESTPYVTKHFLPKAKLFVQNSLSTSSISDESIMALANLRKSDLLRAHRRDSLPEAETAWADAVLALYRSALSILEHKEALTASPEAEMKGLLGAMNGGYTPPSPGGDLVRSPNTVPTGRNLFSINAENTPTITAWNTGKALADATIDRYRQKYGEFPRKVSYTFWAGEFIESEGATIAQVLYMLGVEPVRDRMGRVTDLALIPSETLGRPRIDVVVQTSGQLRDLAASRLTLITKAVQMASEAKDDMFANYVNQGTINTEKRLVESGVAPDKARHLSGMRIFGGLNGSYGTGIKAFIEKGDAWDKTREIADVYMNNMSAIYGSEEEWGAFVQDLFRISLEHTDVIVQPRQNNTWGALSLDHMYEFMGGVNASIEQVTGKVPDTYLADYRNRNRRKLQELKEAIGVESRTTILNPEYIKEKMKGGASSAATFAKTIRNTYGWDATKSDAIDNELWDAIYETYVEDKHRLGVQEYFEGQNPFALQEIAGVMLETARKGLWQADGTKIGRLADLYADLVERHGASGSEFTDNNEKLKAFISDKLPEAKATQFANAMRRSNEVRPQDGKSIVLKQEGTELLRERGDRQIPDVVMIIGGVLIGVIVLLLLLRRQRR